MNARPLLVVLAILAGACSSLKNASPADDAGTSADGGALPGDDAASPADGGADADAIAPIAGDPRWPNWLIPADAPASSAFTITNGADGAIITDATTGLSWQDTPLAGPFVAPQAQQECEALTYDGFSDWRAPTRIEMMSIMSFATTVGATTFTTSPPFSATTGVSCFWTGSPSIYPNYGWRVTKTSIDQASASQSCGLRCVRGGAPLPATPVKRVYPITTDTVFDQATRLVWERAHGVTGSWAAAGARCTAMSLGGKPARLPSVKELSSIIDETASSPSADPAFDASVGRYFTSNPVWVVDFSDGSTVQFDTTGFGYAVRCVAGP